MGSEEVDLEFRLVRPDDIEQVYVLEKECKLIKLVSMFALRNKVSLSASASQYVLNM